MSARRVLRAGGLHSHGMGDRADVPSFSLPQTFTVTLWMKAYPFGPAAFEWAFIHLYPGVWYGTASLTVEIDLRAVFRIHGSDGNAYDVWALSVYDAGLFTHVACVCDGARIMLYKNGTRVAEKSIPVPPAPSTNTLILLRHGFGTSHTPMTIADFRVYNRALSNDEIRAIYERGALIRDGLVLLLDFSEYEGDIAYDKSGCGNHATIYGARWATRKPSRVLHG